MPAVARRARGAWLLRPRALAIAALCALSAVALFGCGGAGRADAGEPSATFNVRLLRASFPSSQAIARPTRMEIVVQNTGPHAVPNLAVTVDSFNYASNYPELAANKRPVWAIERGPGAPASRPVETQEVSQPGNAQTAYVNTWALGRLPAGASESFVWQVVPVKAGTHTVRFSVAAGLAGRARARLSSASQGGSSGAGAFTVNIAPAPPLTHVNPLTGRIAPGGAPAIP